MALRVCDSPGTPTSTRPRSAASATTSAAAGPPRTPSGSRSMLPFERTHRRLRRRRDRRRRRRVPVRAEHPGRQPPVRRRHGRRRALPTHRRQGILGRMMRAQLADVRERGEPIAALWASEETIYGRFGYGLAAQDVMIRASRVHAALQPGLPGRVGTTRLVGHDEALKVFPRIYDRVRRTTPGFISRSKAWWELRKLDDRPERRRGGGELNRVLLEIDGRPVGLRPLPDQGRVRGRHQQEPACEVLEAIGDSPVAVRELWRYLLGDRLDGRDRLRAAAGRPPALPARAAAEPPRLEGLRRPLAAARRPAAPRSRRAPSPATAASRSRSRPTRSSPTTSAPGRSRTASRAARAAAPTSGSTCRRSPAPTSAASRSPTSRAPAASRRSRAAASRAPTRSTTWLRSPGVPKYSEPRDLLAV